MLNVSLFTYEYLQAMLETGPSSVTDIMPAVNVSTLYRITGTSVIMFLIIANNMMIAVTSDGKTAVNMEMNIMNVEMTVVTIIEMIIVATVVTMAQAIVKAMVTMVTARIKPMAKTTR